MTRFSESGEAKQEHEGGATDIYMKSTEDLMMKGHDHIMKPQATIHKNRSSLSCDHDCSP